MSNIDQFRTQVETIRTQTLTIFNDLDKKTREFELGQLPMELDIIRQQLATNSYTVLVVGEAKRGKSSFVNALIGQDLLPTDVDIATNQVFRVSNAEQEHFCLRFEDESTREISKDELSSYGSQVAADQRRDLQFGLDILRWIEVDIPACYIPKGVSILDTPGMGSLYAAHAQITQRFIPRADAVIFVLDSKQPIVQFELDFLEAIIKVTPHIFFIQTKIDLYDRASWQAIQKRNETILQEHFKGKLDDTRVWPISSRNLMKAAQTNNPAFIKVSRKDELLDALQLFLFKVAGWNRCAKALLVADHYYTNSEQVLAGRLTALEGKSTQELADIHSEAEQRLQQFEDDWGKNGRKRKDLLAGVQRMIYAGKSAMIDFLDADSQLEADMRHKIDALKNLKEANDLGATMSEDLVTAANSKWHELCEAAKRDCTNLLSSLVASTDAFVIVPVNPGLVTHIGQDVHKEITIWERFSDIGSGVQKGWGVGATVGVVILTVASTAAAAPFVVAGVLIAGIVGGAGWQLKHHAKEQLASAREDLHKHLTDILQQLRKRFLEPDLRFEGKSLVYSYFDTLAQSMNERITNIIEEKSSAAQLENQRLAEQSKLDRQQRATKVEQTRAQLAAWYEIGRSITSTKTDFNQIALLLSAPTSPEQ